MKARSPVKFMDVCDVKVIDEDGSLASSMMIEAKKHHHEGTNLDQSRGQRYRVPAFASRILVLCCTMGVSLLRILPARFY